METFFNLLPLIFVVLMGLAIFIYVILDGYDLGVGILLNKASEEEKDKMIASIGPFWDANETWLVLGVGILLIAFPIAHGIILSTLYLPVAIMLFALILRGVAFDFRAKVKAEHKTLWNRSFFIGSLVTALSQGYMLGMYIVGFHHGTHEIIFSLFIGICLAAGYVLVGSSWLIMKAEGDLQVKAVKWAITSLRGTALGLVLVSVATPLVNIDIFYKWFIMPNILYLSIIPVCATLLVIFLDRVLATLPKPKDKHSWVPFAGAAGIFLFGFMGLAYSFFPYIIPGRMTIWQAASAPESLLIILLGVVLVLPFIVGYTIFAYRIFWGKVQDLRYD